MLARFYQQTRLGGVRSLQTLSQSTLFAPSQTVREEKRWFTKSQATNSLESLQNRNDYQETVGKMIQLNTLRPNPGAHKKARRVGRGPGSTKGKTCGRGQKGARSRSGKETSPWFEGGQTPLYQRVKKYGFSNYHFKRTYEPLNLSTLQGYIDRGILDPKETVTMRKLRECNIIRKNPGHGIKLLARSNELFSTPNLKIEVSQCSERAREVIERQGGSVQTIYLDRLGLRNFLRKPLSEISTKFAAAKLNQRKFYDVWHYRPDAEGRPLPIDAQDYKRKSAKKEKGKKI